MGLGYKDNKGWYQAMRTGSTGGPGGDIKLIAFLVLSLSQLFFFVGKCMNIYLILKI